MERDDTLPTGSDSQKRKQVDEEENLPRSKRVKRRVDYRYLDDPYWDENDPFMEYYEQSHQTFAGDPMDLPDSLKESKRSSEWAEWEKAIGIELDQLGKTGTWELVDKPSDAIPVSNKWVFDKKRNKAGKIIKYKARLVAKGCSQRPGYDYQETFLPVVQMETIRAILSMVPIKKLKIQQMDVKGAYLNGILKEKVYMRQPEGYDDGTGRVCLLIKTL
jgi:reverse transcriptase-like protein